MDVTSPTSCSDSFIKTFEQDSSIVQGKGNVNKTFVNYKNENVLSLNYMRNHKQ